MKLKNNALQELYDTMTNLPLSTSPYEESPIEKAFRECDEKLSESVTFEKIRSLQIDNDILKGSNKFLYSANAEMAGKTRKLEKEVEDLKKAKLCLEQSRQGWVNRANKSVEEFNLANKEITELKNRLDKANADRTERENEAIRELVDVRSKLNYCTHSRDNWRSRAKHAENEIEALKEDNKDLEKRLMETTETLKKDYDRLFEENRKLKARGDCHRYEVEWYRKHYKEQSDKIKDLTDLWVALQNVNDSQPFELATCFPDVTGMEDILSWDLEDFLDAYKKWWEEKEKKRLDHMRDYLDKFCSKRFCDGCPLESTEYKCGCGYSFKDTHPIPDEELERYYNRVRLYNSIWHGTGKIKFEPWTCSMEAKVEINRDLLNKICGIDSDD